MFAKKEKISVWRWVGWFFGGMVVFTLLSRGIYQHGTAVVTTAKPGSGNISHTVQITGKTVANQEVAVTTVAGLRVGSVCVNEGQQVSPGQTLFRLDLDYLEETILKQKQEMEKQRLTIQDAANQNTQAQKQRANQQAQAAENYDAAVSQGQTALERAQRELQQAQDALERFQNGVLDDSQQEAALEQQLQAAEQTRKEKEEALTRLEQERAAAIEQAIARAEQMPGQTGETTGEEGAQPAALTPEEKAAIEAEVTAQYAMAMAQAQQEAEQAQTAAEATKSQLESFRQTQSGDGGLTEQTLQERVEQAQEAYEDALTALNNAQTTYGRALATANLPASTSHSAQIGQITYAQMELELEKLEALKEGNGEVVAPTEGIVTRCNVQTGEKTTDTTAILLADTGQGCQFSGLATEEQSQYIGVGDMVNITTGKTGKTYRELPVTTFATKEETGGGYRVTVQMGSNTLVPGATAQLHYTQKSQLYSCCVPLGALRLDEKNQTYVLVVRQRSTVMGKQWQAEKVNVTVLEQGQTNAALAEGVLDGTDNVIVSADRSIEPGSRVRVQ